MPRSLPTLALALLAVAAGCAGGSPPLPADGGITPVHAIQGDGATSPLKGRSVVTEGIVSGDFQDGDSDTAASLGGFYLLGKPDGDDATSDGVFVFDGGAPATDVNVGDRVRVQGDVAEFFGETQLAATKVTVIGSGTAAPVTLPLPADGVVANDDGELIADLERYEGMLVRLGQPLAIANLRGLEPFGTLTISAGDVPMTMTNVRAPDATAWARHRESVAAARLILDDGRRDANHRPIRYLADGAPRLGDRVTGLTGTLRFSRGSGGRGPAAWRLVPTAAPVFEAANPRPAAPAVPGAVRVAALNLLNWFSTVDDGQPRCAPAGDEHCRGADSDTEKQRQLARIVTAIGMLDADVVGLVELENNASASLEALVDGLNERFGAGSWDYVDTGTIGNDVIRTGFVYRPAAATPSGPVAVLDAGVDARFNDGHNRPVPAQTFAFGAARLTIAVVHLKSKGSDCEDVGDPDAGDGQGNCNLTRRDAARALADWLASDPTGSGDDDVLIVGDFNAYLFEDPLTSLAQAGYTNLVRGQPGGGAYSFAFDGQRGALDHAFASPSLLPQVAGIAEWHSNADEAPVLDYNLENGRDPALFDADMPYRASDHDPLIVGLDLVP